MKKRIALLVITWIAGLLGFIGQVFGQAFSFNDQAFLAQGSSGEPLLTGLRVVWNFDEQFFGPTNRFSSYSATTTQVLTNSGSLTGSARSLSGGGVSITNSGAGILVDTNASMFGINSSFTIAFWVIGGNSGSGNCIVGQGVNSTAGHYDWIWDTQSFLTADAGNNLHTATGTAISSSSWLFVVCGYDAANNQIFISNNGGARVNASAGGSIRQTANMPFTIGVNPAIFDNVMFWNRVITAAEINRLYSGGFPFQYPFTSGTNYGISAVSGYMWGIQANGGTTTTANSNAVVNLVNGMVTTNLWSRVPIILALGGNALADALVPVKCLWTINGGNAFIFSYPNAGTASGVYMNNNFVDADVSINGMKGDGSTKFLTVAGGNNAVGLSAMSPNYNSAAQTIYYYTAGLENNKYTGGAYDDFASPNNGIFMVANYSGVGQGGSIGLNLGAYTNSTPLAGYNTFTRVSSTEQDLYFGNALFDHGLYGQNTTANTKASPDFNLAMSLFCVSFRNAGNFGLTTNTISYWSYAPSGFSLADSSNYFWLVENFLTTKGGGAAPPFTTQPTNSVVLVGNAKTLYAVSGGSPSYQWTKNGANIANATQSSYTIATAALSDFGTYQCNATLNSRTYGSTQIQLATVTTTTVSNWVVQCAVNGAALLSSNTIYGVDQFWNGLVTDGISGNFKVINCFVPDSFLAACTPLLAGNGSTLWVNHNFVNGDISVNGLTGNGSTKYLDTGFNASTGLTSPDNCGISLYGYSTTSGAYRDSGCYVLATDSSYGLQLNASDIASGAANFGAGQGASGVSVHPSPGNGFYSGSRVSNTDSRLFYATSGSAWAQIGNNTTARTTTFLNGSTDVFASYIPSVSLGYEPTAATLSYASFRDGFDSAHGQLEFNRVQTMRQTFGGGFR